MTHYERFLTMMTDQIFEEAVNRFDWTWDELADHAGVARSTVYRLGTRFTRYPQLRTFFLLAKAVRMNVRLIRKELTSHEAKSQEAAAAVHI